MLFLINVEGYQPPHGISQREFKFPSPHIIDAYDFSSYVFNTYDIFPFSIVYLLLFQVHIAFDIFHYFGFTKHRSSKYFAEKVVKEF